MTERKETAECRHCRRELKGKPYYMGGPAYIPETGKRARVNHYGGFVCSRECDFQASVALERSMPGHSYNQQTLGCYSRQSFARNWDE